MSEFIEDAVKWRMLDQTMAEAGFADLSPEAVEALFDEAVTAVRPYRRRAVRLAIDTHS